MIHLKLEQQEEHGGLARQTAEREVVVRGDHAALL